MNNRTEPALQYTEFAMAALRQSALRWLILARFQKAHGTISRIEPSRTFIDGVLCQGVEFAEREGTFSRFENVFFTLKLSSVLKPRKSGQFYFWNSHCYAFRNNHDLIEDIDGARASYFKRDARLLLWMAVSVVLLPFVIFVTGKKLLRAGSRMEMRSFLSQ